MKTYTEVTISREELYQRIWERPMRDVAADLGISDVGLKKTCRRVGIPTPPQGYHLMAEEAAKNHLKAPLPPATDRQPVDLVFRITDKAVVSAEQQAILHAREMNTRELPPPTLEQRQTIDSALKDLRRQVNVRQTDRRGMVVTSKDGYPIRVSPQSFERAFGFLDVLLTRFTCAGATQILTNGNRGRAVAGFELEGFEFQVSIEETSKRIELPPPPTPKRLRSDRPILYFSPTLELRPTGRLTLTVWGPARGRSMKTFRDGVHPIENCLDQLVEWTFLQAAVAKEEARIASERKQRAVDYLREKDKPQLEAEFLKRRRQQLHKEALQWRQATALRQYISAVEKTGPLATQVGPDSCSTFDDWLAWAKSYADAMDPISRSEAGLIPPYPEPAAYERIPSVFLDYDDPAEADRVLKAEPWRRY